MKEEVRGGNKAIWWGKKNSKRRKYKEKDRETRKERHRTQRRKTEKKIRNSVWGKRENGISSYCQK